MPIVVAAPKGKRRCSLGHCGQVPGTCRAQVHVPQPLLGYLPLGGTDWLVGVLEHASCVSEASCGLAERGQQRQGVSAR